MHNAHSLYQDTDYIALNPRFYSATEHRSPFQIDRDRIVYSPALRRLQGKTQVFHSFLVGSYDFYRTRLTHSLEVAQIGRAICQRLQQLEQNAIHVDADLVEAACLAHDLGHPPFGHTGEKALNQLMQSYGGFEGNAQTLRLLTSTLFTERSAGMNPTRAFLDAVLKYKTLRHETPAASNHYLYDEQAKILQFVMYDQPFPIALSPGKARNAFRSIECQIMDWADDTAYSINDLSDAIHTGFIQIASLEKWAETQNLDCQQSEHLDYLIQAIHEQKIESRLGRCIGENIRACQVTPIDTHLSAYTQRHAWQLNIDPRILKRTHLYKKIARELVFNTTSLHQLDFKASSILERLFEVLHDRYVLQNTRLHLQLLPLKAAQPIEQSPNPQTRARMLCDWITNLTDRTALQTYQRLFDLANPSQHNWL